MPKISFSEENTTRREHTVSVIELKVPSNSEADKFYYVSVSCTCSCPSFIYRNKCAHIHQVLDTIAPRPVKMQDRTNSLTSAPD